MADAYLTMPDEGEHPGALFVMDAIGLRPRIVEMCDRIASWGYVVLAPNVFYRNGTAAETSPDGPLDSDEKRGDFFKGAGPRIAGLTTKLARVPDDAVLFPGHLYSAEPSATMGETRQWNFVFKPKSEREWLAMFGR